MRHRYSLALAGLAAICSHVAEAAPVDCGATPPAIRKAYFPRVGVGADYGPHYPCYNMTSGAIAECLTNAGAPVAGVQADAKNGEMQASVPLDLAQLQLAGFKTVRAYGDSSKVWIAMINAANALSAGGSSLNVVYQVSTCKSDAARAGHPCVNAPGATFQSTLAFSLRQLRQVISQVTPAGFQKAVKLFIVGNEDLIISPTDNKTYNTLDLMGAIQQTRAELIADGIVVNNGSGNGVDLSSATVIGQMTTPPGIQLATAFTPGAPVIENVYGAQFSSVKTPADGIAFLKAAVNKMQARYANTRPAMLGETGWWTAGQDANYQASTRVGTVPDAKAYYQALYPYLSACSVPALIFEAFDQPTKSPAGKKPNPAGAQEAEQHYGVMNAFNTAKDAAMLPAPAPGYRNHPETQNAALFTFIQTQPIGTAAPMTFGVKQPGAATPTKVTIKPLDMVTPTGTTPVWPTFNLYVGSQLSLFRAAADANPQCVNAVTSIYRTSQQYAPGSTGARQWVAPYSGGVWLHKAQTAPGCLAYTPTNVNWGIGATLSSLAQNVYMVSGFSTNPGGVRLSR